MFQKKNFKKILTTLFLIACVFAIYFSLDSIFSNSSVQAAWYNTGGTWTNRKSIAVDHQKVSGTTTLSNFPMLVSVIDPDLRHTSHGGKVGKTDGTDILFTSSNGSTKLDHEIEKYASTTGELVAWVEIPSLSPTTTTQLYMYFGNSGASDQQNVTGVWDSDYKGVWHLKDGTNLSLTDSTSNATTGTQQNTSAVSGKIDGASSFTGATNSNITFGLPTALQVTNVTISVWANTTNLNTSSSRIFGKNITSNPPPYLDYGLSINASNQATFAGSPNNTLAETGTYTLASTGVWYYIVGTYNGSAMKLYVDGVERSSVNKTGNLGNNSGSVDLGGSITSGSNINWYDGLIDEARISNIARSADWIATEYKNQSSPNTFYSYGGLEQETRSNAGAKATSNTLPGFSWYNTSWTNAKPILVDRTKVVATLYDFPMLVSVIDPDLRHTSHGGKVGKTDGTDILFTDADGTTKLDHEIEKYASTTGELVAWVKVVTLSHTADTGLYMYFGNSGAADQQNATGVWDGNYLAVWHLKSNSNGTLNGDDSTSNNYDGTLYNTPTATSSFIGGQGGSFINSSSQRIASSSGPNIANSEFTVSFWQKQTSSGSNMVTFNLGTSANNNQVIHFVNPSDTIYRFGMWNDDLTVSSLPSILNRWIYVTATLNSSFSQVMFHDGVSIGSRTASGYFTGNTSWNIGAIFSGSSFFNGVIDEVRISNIVRSNDWIVTEYKNQYSPNTFYSYGRLMSQTRQKPSGAPAPNINNRGGVKFR